MSRPASLARAALAAALVLVATATRATAQDSAQKVVTKITADLGYVETSGNTQVTTINFGERLTQERGRFTLQQGLAFVYGEQRDTVNTNYLRASLRGDYKVDKVLAVFLGAAFDRNTFAGIERRFEEQIGLQARLLAKARDTVSVEGGGSITQQIGTDGTQENFPSARGALSWRHGFTAAAYFLQGVEFIPNLKENEDWRVNSESSIVAPVSAKIGLKVSYVIRYDNLPQAGFQELDKLFTTGIQITF